MAAPRLHPLLVSEAEFLGLPETTERVELLDGEVIVPPAPTPLHQHVLLDVYAALRSWAEAHPPATVLAAPVDVRFGAGRILQPDLFVVLAGLPRDAPSPVTVVPDLVAEVLGGANRSYDRITKRAVYADAGVREYWVIDLQRRCVERYQGRESADSVDDTLRSALLPGFELDLPALFRS